LWQFDTESPLHLQHISTQITDPGNGMFRTFGQTVWATRSASGQAGMAWDWVALGQGVVAMADPMAVITNLRLVDEAGSALNPMHAARLINTIVHRLPWQNEVGRVLDELAAEQPEHALASQRPGSWQRTAH
jgi:hypothetical protein